MQGGVTSSSLEVLAGLGLNDEEYIDLMMFKDGKSSSFCEFRAASTQDTSSSTLTARPELRQGHPTENLRERRRRVYLVRLSTRGDPCH